MRSSRSPKTRGEPTSCQQAYSMSVGSQKMVSTTGRLTVDGATFQIQREGSAVLILTRTDESSHAPSGLESPQINEAEHSAWVARGLSSPSRIVGLPAPQARREPSSRAAARVPLISVREPSVSEQLHLALARSGYPLQHVHCRCDDQSLTLTGFTTRYYYVQIALHVAMTMANGRRIEMSIHVVPAPAACSP